MQCSKCGYNMQPFETSCPRCARAGSQAATAPDTNPADLYPQTKAFAPVYAGFWTRFWAYLIDSVILVIAVLAIGFPLGLFSFAINPPSEAEMAAFMGKQLAIQGISVIVMWLYFALFESSAKQATPGKIALGIIVTDVNGSRITFGRATIRYLG